MSNYLEKLLCVEIIEKICRMARFVALEADEPHRHDIKIVGVFKSALLAILENLRPRLERLSLGGDLAQWERVAFVRQLSDVFSSLEQLHEHLQFIYGVWIRPESMVFVNSVLEFLPEDRRPDNVNVILSNGYSFLETDLSVYVEELLGVADIPIDFENENPSIFLPKIEWSNPLNWSILVHECGHVDSNGLRRLLDRPEIVPKKVDNSTKRVIHNWAEEIYCDLFATRILGPAYLASFATFAVLAAGAGGSEIETETHPADILRLALILEELEKRGLQVDLSQDRLGAKDMGRFFFNIVEERTKLDRLYMNVLTQQPQPFIDLQELVDIICEQVDENMALDQHLTLTDFARIEGLAQRLTGGIIIGSYPHAMDQSTRERELPTSVSTTAELQDAKDLVCETRSLLWEIVNAGWLYKVEYLYPEAFALFFDSNNAGRSVEEKATIWEGRLEQTDRMLLKSIESSEIHKLMEEA